MELLGRVGAAIGISLAITLLLLVLYQDDVQVSQEPVVTHSAAVQQSTP